MNETEGRFITLLKQEINTLEELHALLLDELAALKQRDSDLIENLAEEKNKLLNKIGMLDKQRQLYVEEHTDANYEENSFTKTMSELSGNIEASLEKCRHQNQINGGVIEISTLFNKKILDIVCGNNTEEVVYCADGKNDSNKNQNSLAHV